MDERRTGTASTLALIVVMVLASSAAATPFPLEPAASFAGEGSYEYAGYAVAGVGDVDADGFDDFVVSAPNSSEGGSLVGQVYLFFGRAAGWSTGVTVTTADASFVGEHDDDKAGRGVSHGGDLNGDGYSDFLIGAPYNEDGGSSVGKVYVLLGRSYGWPLDTYLGSADASFLGKNDGGYAGAALDIAGDLDGDGFDDLLISAPWASVNGASDGITFVVAGHAGPWQTDVSLDAADSAFIGEMSGDLAGRSVAAAGDVDGDGLADLIVGAPLNDEEAPDAGQAYLLFGVAGLWAAAGSLSGADASFLGSLADDNAGCAVSGAGDVDGDGLDDILIGACDASSYVVGAGQVHLVLGAASGWAMDIPLSSADAIYHGLLQGDNAGSAVDIADDLDGDGFDDLLVGSPNGDGLDADIGEAFVVRGRASGWIVGVPLSDADASLQGDEYGDYMGCSLSGVGDVNGDGYGDVLVGADYDALFGVEAGAAHLVFGFPDEDQDGDGSSTWDGDCDDSDPSTYPGAPEIADGVDNDCDGIVDEGTTAYDDDDDGFTEDGGDCDDADDQVWPGAPESCDGVDSDCDGSAAIDEVDLDSDGYLACEECDDNEPTTFPGATEVCDDDVDSDCEDDLEDTEVDSDGDSFSECGGDCDDTSDAVNPLAPEVCNGGVDDDCNPDTDETADLDGDGYTLCDGECDDHDANTHPDRDEACDGVDNDCDGFIDEDIDEDVDGYLGCEGDDCDDHNAGVYPGAPEIPYDGVDQDCSGADLTDVDMDGYDGGATGADCNDMDAATHPGATEVCDDGLDNDCNGAIDGLDDTCGGNEHGGGCECHSGVGQSVTGCRDLLWAGILTVALLAKRRR